jgi:HEAT repeat protein
MNPPPPASLGVFTTDTELRVRSWDDWISQITGVARGAACGQPLADLFPDLERRGLLARLRRVITEGTTDILAPAFHQHFLPCAPVVPSRRYTQMQQRITMAPLREHDRIIGALVTLEDVTARREHELDLAAELTSADTTLRLRAAREMAAGPGEAAPELIGALADESWRVRRCAVEGLTRQPNDQTVTQLLLALRERHHDPSVLNSALSVLAMSNLDVVTPLIRFLAEPDADLRVYAALALGLHADPRAVPALLQALSDADANVQYHAIEALGRLRATEAVAPLLAIAEARDFFLAFPALDALTRIGDASIADRLVPLLEDDLLRAPAADTLGQLGDEKAVLPLAGLLNKPGAPVPVIAQALVGLHDHYQQAYQEGAHIADLARHALKPEGAQNLLAALAASDGQDLRPLVCVLGWLTDAGAEAALVRLLGHDKARKDVVEALVRHGERVTGLLIQQIEAEDADTRVAAVVALGRIGDRRAVPALLGLLRADPELVVVTTGALARIGDPRALEPLLEVLEWPETAARQAAIAALNSLGHPDLPARTEALLRSPNPCVRESAARIAGYFGYANCVEPLLALGRDPEENVRRAAAESIAFLEDPRVLPALSQAIREDTPRVRASAAQGLGQTGRREAVPVLISALEDNDAWVRYFSARALGQLGAPEMVEPLARLAQSDPANHVRAAALGAIGRLGGSRAASILAPFLEASDSDLSRAAIQALGQVNHPDALPPLMAVLRSALVERRLDAVQALGERGGRGVAGALQWVAAVDADARVAQKAIAALAHLSTPEAIAALIALTADASRRELCVAGLARTGEKQIALVAQGLKHAHVAVRCAVAEALARMKCPAATERLREALDDVAAVVRLAAITALGRLGSRQAERQLLTLTRSDPDAAVRRAAQEALRR